MDSGHGHTGWNPEIGVMPLRHLFKKIYWSLAIAGLVYVSSLFALTNPTIQRHALYAHKVNPTYWQDINDVERFGFLQGQVQPFQLTTPDSETLYAWHVLPAHLFDENAWPLGRETQGPVEDHSITSAFKLLASHPLARVVVNFHGNAAHLASSYRPISYTNFLSTSTPTHPTHVLTIDYRGFGLSTGHPTESGLITDGVTLLNHIINNLGVPPSRIVIVGQSLGTAVAAAVAEHFNLEGKANFAGIILVSGFCSLPRLLETYSVKGVTPHIFAPLRGYPSAQEYFQNRIVDSWDTASRIRNLTQRGIVAANPGGTYITILHARDDWEIPWREGQAIFDAAVDSLEQLRTVYRHSGGNETEILEVEDRAVRVRWEKLKYGGHNRVVTFQAVAKEVLKAFDRSQS